MNKSVSVDFNVKISQYRQPNYLDHSRAVDNIEHLAYVRECVESHSIFAKHTKIKIPSRNAGSARVGPTTRCMLNDKCGTNDRFCVFSIWCMWSWGLHYYFVFHCVCVCFIRFIFISISHEIISFIAYVFMLRIRKVSFFNVLMCEQNTELTKILKEMKQMKKRQHKKK